MRKAKVVFGFANRYSEVPSLQIGSRASRSIALIALATLFTASGFKSADASIVFGTLSNFDIYNTTPEPSEGAEIELEGVHSSSLSRDFPAHYAASQSSSTTMALAILWFPNHVYKLQLRRCPHAGLAIAQPEPHIHQRSCFDLYSWWRALRFLVVWRAANGNAILLAER